MPQIITALAQAHRALLETSADPTGAFAPTARKIEATLVGVLATMAPTDYTRADVAALLNSGSLKALKCAPTSDTPLRAMYNTPGPDPVFILAQGAAYVKEARKRGFALDAGDRMRMLERAVTGEDATPNAALVLEGPVDVHLMMKALALGLAHAGPKLGTTADLLGKLASAGVAHKADHAAHELAKLCVIHDPALASPTWTKAVTAFAILGVKPPAKDGFEHTEVAKAVAALFAPAGRKALKAQWPNLAAWLLAGAPAAAELAPIDRARADYRTAARPRW